MSGAALDAPQRRRNAYPGFASDMVARAVYFENDKQWYVNMTPPTNMDFCAHLISRVQTAEGEPRKIETRLVDVTRITIKGKTLLFGEGSIIDSAATDIYEEKKDNTGERFRVYDNKLRRAGIL
jgi:hypothetical protein